MNQNEIEDRIEVQEPELDRADIALGTTLQEHVRVRFNYLIS